MCYNEFTSTGDWAADAVEIFADDPTVQLVTNLLQKQMLTAALNSGCRLFITSATK